MPHINELFDYVVSIFIVRRDRVLLVHHKRYDEWLPIGGHIELDEDPEQALRREVREECGLRVRLLNPTPDIAHRDVKPLPTPSYMDVHRISRTHGHIAFVYFAVSTSGEVRLHEREHREYRWVPASELGSPDLRLTRSIRFYCRKALEAARRARR
ncbi:MAG: hypothetical protein MOGMAGMI_00552 [Candidatus Omnitrophica bacterium]|nr:hypothetical protein [Candidatus Omnitrophota bacterium]